MKLKKQTRENIKAVVGICACLVALFLAMLSPLTIEGVLFCLIILIILGLAFWRLGLFKL